MHKHVNLKASTINNTLLHRIYKGGVPVYVVADPDLLKHIMVKDFSHFVDRVPVRTTILVIFNKLKHL